MAAKKPRTPEEAIKQRRDQLAAKAENRSLLLRVVLIAVVCWGFFHYLFLITQVKGMDMFPAVKDGDLAIVFRLQQEYAKNDVIVYRTETGLKFGRIVARATDNVTIDDSGSLTVNGTTQTGEILYPTYPEEDSSLPTPIRCRRTACSCWATTAPAPPTAACTGPYRWIRWRARSSPF